MIIKQYKCIFIHIPKTGGTSILRLLAPYRFNTGKPPQDHSKPSVAIQHKPKLWRGYFTFTFVRNPWDRAVSCFLYNKKVATHDKEKRGWKLNSYRQLAYESETFDEFILCADRNIITKGILHTQPQILWILKPNGKPFGFDFIGRFEKFQEDFEHICKRIGFPQKQLPHEVKSQERQHYTEYYTNKSQKIVEDIYKTEIEYFNYKFGD